MSARDDYSKTFFEDDDWYEEAMDEIDLLRRWKSESTAVLDEWERVWLAAGSPGPLGGSKADNVRRFIKDMIG